LQHLAPLAQQSYIILQLNWAQRGHFSPLSMEGGSAGWPESRRQQVSM
jgi:hypothetical protein